MKKIALIHDLSGFGKCSLTAAIPVISALGIQACPLPTAILSAQTGFQSYYYDDYTEKMTQFIQEWKNIHASFDGIYSGYLVSPKQADIILSFLDSFQTDKTVYLADPVLGDHGKKIVNFSDELLQGMLELCKRSTICTPNVTELCLLADVSYEALVSHANESDYPSRVADVCHKLLIQNPSMKSILVTGVLSQHKEQSLVGNLAVSTDQPDTFLYLTSPYNGKSFSGTGDLFSSVICGSFVQGLSLEASMKKAMSFLQPAIEEASVEQTPTYHGIPFEKYLNRLY